MFDTSLLITIAVIFVATLIGSYLRRAKRDRCLKDFDDFHVTVERTDDLIVWGTMHLFSTGMELEYHQDVRDEDHIETSYVMYKDEYPDIQAIFRYTDELDEEGRRTRDKEVERAFHPTLLRKLGRDLRNLINSTADAINEVMVLLLGRVSQTGAKYITAPGTERLKDISKTVIGYVGTSYDPLLEQYIGLKVVAEVVEDDKVYEYTGVLKEYSADFLELLDVSYPYSYRLNLLKEQGQGQKGEEPVAEQEPTDERGGTTEGELAELKATHLTAVMDEGVLRVENLYPQPVFLHSLQIGESSYSLYAVADISGEVVLALDDVVGGGLGRDREVVVIETGAEVAGSEAADVQAEAEVTADREKVGDLEPEARGEGEEEDIILTYRVIRELDMIVPRAHALIRHRAERYDPTSVFEVGWDVITSLSDEDFEDESVYRERLAEDSYDAQSTAKLGLLLARKRQWPKARQWLEKALTLRDALPDGGRMVERQLKAVRKKVAQTRSSRR